MKMKSLTASVENYKSLRMLEQSWRPVQLEQYMQHFLEI